MHLVMKQTTAWYVDWW